jgi:hypothetical protein
MRTLHIAAVLALFGSTVVAHAGAPKAHLGGYGPASWVKVRPVQDAFAQVRCARIAPTYWTEQMPAGSYLNLR